MISRLWTAFLLSLACASTIAWLVALMHEKNVRPVQDLVAFFKKQSKVGRVILGTFFIAMWVIASTKPGDGGGLLHTHGIAAEDLGGGGMLVGAQMEQRYGFFVLVAQGLGADHLGDGQVRTLLPADGAEGKVGHSGHGAEGQHAGDVYAANVHRVHLLKRYLTYFTMITRC